MRRDIVFLDVETPNRRNDSICSMGLIRTDYRGKVLSDHSILVDPQARFDRINTSIHGICAADVSGEPDFGELWDAGLADVLADARIVAHNAAFDLSVLRKSLARYGLSLAPTEFACTLKLARRAYPQLPDHRLDTVSKHLAVPLAHHHDAFEDAKACYLVFSRMCRGGAADPHACWQPCRFD